VAQFFEDVICCSPNDSLWSVIETLVECQIHRVLVVDERQRLRGLVSLSDLFKFFLVPIVETSNLQACRTSEMIDSEMLSRE
jgi:CBS-domain-containing membrane protein